MTISDDEHDLISNLTRSLAADVIGLLETLARWGTPLLSTRPDHYCAYETDDESEELIIRMPSRSISIKVSVKDVEYAKDRVRSEGEVYEEDIETKLDDFLNTILKRGNNDFT